MIWRNIFVVVDDGQVDLEDIGEIAQCVLELGDHYPHGVGGLTIIPADGRPPSEEHRQAVKRAYTRVSRHLKAMCWMVEGQGFRAATIRAALAGLRLLLHPPFPTKVAAGLDEGVTWLCEQLKSDLSGGVGAAIMEIRADLKEVELSRESLHPVAGEG